MPQDLHILPKLRDSLSFHYVEHAVIEQDEMSIVVLDKNGRTPVPIASLTTLFVGPGTTITHAAVKAICDNGCMIVWCGEGATRCYGFGSGETRSAKNLLLQAQLCMDPDAHLAVVRRMYERRFPGISCQEMNLKQIRGLEGVRVREMYRLMSRRFGVAWKRREHTSDNWDDNDPINKALSAANACLYGLCHAAIVSLGYSPGLGFIHTGKMLSFVYDIADLYKADTTIPAAFATVASKPDNLERQVRINCRREFRQHRVLYRIADDIAWVFQDASADDEINAVPPGDLWDIDSTVRGGRNYARTVIAEEKDEV